ncbi:MAG: hypothetical protein QXT20_02945 [Candidatus Woesearchaeota archaeon]
MEEEKEEHKEKKAEHHEAKKHKLHEKLLIAKHHVKRNGWKYLSITLLAIIAVFSILTALHIFTVKYNGLPTQTSTPEMIVISDKRCADCEQAVQVLVPQLKSILPEVKITQLDYSDKKARELMASTKIKYLPAILFTPSVNTTANYSIISPYLDKAEKYLSLRIGASFDPTAEICDNGIDDNGNALIDCQDPECINSLACRDNKPGNLQVFIMSDCPYGKLAVIALGELVKVMPNMTYDVHYIADETSPGVFNSLHGPYEADEDIIQLCVKKYSSKQWLDYIVCRSKEGIRGNDWHNCAQNTGVDIAKVESCFNGTEGKNLLSEDIKIARALGIGASPTWLANNRYTFGGIQAASVQQQFCKYNEGMAGCNATVSQQAPAPSGSCG